MRRVKRAVQVGLMGVALIPSYCMPGQQPSHDDYRELNIEGHGAQPAMHLKVRAAEREGYVSVRDDKGNEVQGLSCTLLRDHPKATQEEWAGARDQFVAHFVVEDFDSDGSVDLAGVRDYGAKWGRYCVWLFDAKQQLFVRDFLAEQMELLSNLSRLGNGMISSSSLGPGNPWVDVYRIVGTRDGRPARQLLLATSCMVETAGNGDKPTAVVITKYEGHVQPEVQRKPVDGMDWGAAMQKCVSGTDGRGRKEERQSPPK